LSRGLEGIKSQAAGVYPPVTKTLQPGASSLSKIKRNEAHGLRGRAGVFEENKEKSRTAEKKDNLVW